MLNKESKGWLIKQGTHVVCEYCGKATENIGCIACDDTKLISVEGLSPTYVVGADGKVDKEYWGAKRKC